MGGCYSKRSFSFRKKRTQKQLPRIPRIDFNDGNVMYTNSLMLQNEQVGVVDNTYEDMDADCHHINQSAHKGRGFLEQTRRVSTDSSMYEVPVVNLIQHTDETGVKTLGIGSDDTTVKTIGIGYDDTTVEVLESGSDNTTEKTLISDSDETKVKTVYVDYGSEGTNVKIVDFVSDDTNIKSGGDDSNETNVKIVSTSSGVTNVKIDGGVPCNTDGMETVGGDCNHGHDSNSRMPTYIDIDVEPVASSVQHIVEVPQPLTEDNVNSEAVVPTVRHIPTCCHRNDSIPVEEARKNKLTETNGRLIQLENEKEQLKRRLEEKKIRRLEKEIRCLQLELDNFSSDEESDCKLSTEVNRERKVNPTEVNKKSENPLIDDGDSDPEHTNKVIETSNNQLHTCTLLCTENMNLSEKTNNSSFKQAKEPTIPAINNKTDTQENNSDWESWFVPSRDWTAHVPLQSMADNPMKLSDSGSQFDLFQMQISTSASFMDIM